jgi:hypothetical protein
MKYFCNVSEINIPQTISKCKHLSKNKAISTDYTKQDWFSTIILPRKQGVLKISIFYLTFSLPLVTMKHI